MTEMRVRGLTPTPDQGAAVVLLETADDARRLAFVIPMNEANRLARVLGLTGCPGVPIYALVRQLTDRLGASIRCARVGAGVRGVVAELELARGDAAITLPCHPADALGLAFQASAPVYATADALAHACPPAVQLHADSASDVARWLERVRPDDFGATGERS